MGKQENPPPGPVRYTARCPGCHWASRPYSRYSTAEGAAKDHAIEMKHRTHVTDHYGMRVVGSGFDQAGNPSGASTKDET